MPVITSYIIPGLGTNVTKLWEFDTALRLGKFRPHHGFVFGTATSLIAYVCNDFTADSFGILELLRSGLIMASVLGFWNWIYDIHAIRAGFIKVYNKQFYEGQGPEAVATDYAPVYFGFFGLIYGIGIRMGQYVFFEVNRHEVLLPIAIVFNLLSLTIPTTMFAIYSMVANGHSGLSRYNTIQEK